MPRGISQRCTASGPPAPMVSPSEEELALLSGRQLVIHLSKTHRRADYEAVSRILEARDRTRVTVEAKLAAALTDLDVLRAREMGVDKAKSDLEAALTELDALREKYKAPAGAHRRPRDDTETEEMALVVGNASPEAVRRDERRVQETKEGDEEGRDFINLCSDEEEDERTAVACEMEMEWDDDEEDTVPLSQRFKRLRRAEPGELESGKGDGLGQSDSVGTLGNDQQKFLSVKMEGPVTRTGKMAGMPEGSKVSASVQESGVVKSENFDEEMPRTMLIPSPGFLGRSALQKGSSKSDYCKDGVPARGVSQPLNKTPMVESSAKCGNKVIGAEKGASLLRLSEEERRLSRDGVPFEPCNGNNALAQIKRETSSLPSTVTSDWKSERHMCASLWDYVEIAMHALCALCRQRKLAIEDARDKCRAHKLAEFLLDGHLQGPMRSAAELENHDATNLPFLMEVTTKCSGQLFEIFSNKEDVYFC